VPTREDPADAELFYAPDTRGLLAPGFVPFVGSLLVGGLTGSALDALPTGLGAGLAVGAVASLLWRRKGDSAGILFRVRDGRLTLAHGKRGGIVFARAPLDDVLDVKIQTDTITINPGNFAATPGFGMNPAGGNGTVEESCLAVVLRDRELPLYLTADRVSNLEATEWHATICLFLRDHGWRPFEDPDGNQPTVDEAGAPIESIELLAIRSETEHYTIRAEVRRFEVVLEAEDRTLGDANAARCRIILGYSELEEITERLIEENGDRLRYSVLEPRQRMPGLMRSVFVKPHGILAMNKLAEWLDQHGIPHLREDAKDML